MKIGLYFGTYNPIHIGHLAIAGYMVEYADVDQVWFVVSPQNPFKSRTNLLEDYHRLEMVNRAIEPYDKLRSSDIEFKLQKPSYTVHTLVALQEKYPQHAFQLIMGEDNLSHFHKWRNHEEILKMAQLLVYPRPGAETGPFHDHESVKMVQAPLMQISSTMIRKGVKEGVDTRYFMPKPAWDFMDEMNFYR